MNLKMKGTPLHASNLVGAPFKDTSSVAMNPIIQFTTLSGLLAVAIALELKLSSRIRSCPASSGRRVFCGIGVYVPFVLLHADSGGENAAAKRQQPSPV